jgi:hypothetical protein
VAENSTCPIASELSPAQLIVYPRPSGGGIPTARRAARQSPKTHRAGLVRPAVLSLVRTLGRRLGTGQRRWRGCARAR